RAVRGARGGGRAPRGAGAQARRVVARLRQVPRSARQGSSIDWRVSIGVDASGGPELGGACVQSSADTAKRGAFWPLVLAVVALCGGVTLVAVPGAAQTPQVPESPAAIEITAQRLEGFEHANPTRRQFGVLEFRGGLALTSRAKEFGGISAIRVQPDGANFIALTDKGWWLKGRIGYEATRPVGIADPP